MFEMNLKRYHVQDKTDQNPAEILKLSFSPVPSFLRLVQQQCPDEMRWDTFWDDDDERLSSVIVFIGL